MASYLITGTARGLGFELTAQLSRLPASEVGIIFATSRNESPGLKSLVKGTSDRVVFVQLDTTDEASIKSAAEKVTKKLKGKGLDVLINNAGIMVGDFSENVEHMSTGNLSDHYNVNILGTHNVTRSFLPLLRQGGHKKILNVSTTLGSITLAESYGTAQPAYKVTKAAENMLIVQWSNVLKSEGFTIFAMSPGWLKTDLGSEYADLDVSVGAKCLVNRLLKASPQENGKLLNIEVEGWENGKPGAGKGEEGPNVYDGKDAPW